MRTRLARQEGQTATEYMLIISVVVVAIVAAAYSFVPTFREGVNELAIDVQSILSTGQIGGVGTPRNYNTASNNSRRCTEQKGDPRYAAMFDPPKCLEDPVLVPAATPAPAMLVQRDLPEPRMAAAALEVPLPGRLPPAPARKTKSFVAIVSAPGVSSRRARRAPRRRA